MQVDNPFYCSVCVCVKDTIDNIHIYFEQYIYICIYTYIVSNIFNIRKIPRIIIFKIFASSVAALIFYIAISLQISFILGRFFFKKLICCYLAIPSLSWYSGIYSLCCSMWNLLVVDGDLFLVATFKLLLEACKLLIAAYEIQFPGLSDQNLALHWECGVLANAALRSPRSQ